MRIAIVDDNQDDRSHLHAMLEEYCFSKDIMSEILEFSSGNELLKIYQPGYFQCVFLDIYMEGLDGMQVARQLYEKDPACRLVFSTISISHAVASYEVHAAWYLTKPYGYDRLSMAMDHACLDILKSSRMLTAHVNGTEINIPFEKIYYVDCINKQAKLHLRERFLIIDENISILTQRLLQDARFLLCNRNTLVNMDHVEFVGDEDFFIHNGEKVPIRQRGRAALKKEYLSWTLKDLRKEERL